MWEFHPRCFYVVFCCFSMFLYYFSLYIRVSLRANLKIIDRYFYNFLSLLDFCKYADANKQEYHARINKNVVYKTSWSEVKEAVNEWLYEKGEDNTVLNAVFKYCSKTGNLDNLNIISIDNSYFGEDWQIFQFQNKQIKVNFFRFMGNTVVVWQEWWNRIHRIDFSPLKFYISDYKVVHHEKPKINLITIGIVEYLFFWARWKRLDSNKKMLAEYFSEKLVDKVGEAVKERQITEQDLDRWLNK